MTKYIRSILISFLIIGALGLAGYFVSTYLFLSQVRYFDADEFAYLSWAHQMLFKRPYVDYYQITPPGYLLFLLPFVKDSSASGVSTFLEARLASTLITIVTAGVVSFLFFTVQRSWVALLAGVFFLFLPMPGCKYMEIRPDMLSLLFLLLGMTLQIRFMRKVTKPQSDNAAQPALQRCNFAVFFSGFFYSLSVMTLQKSALHVVLATIIMLIWSIQKGWKYVGLFVIGGLLVPIVFLLWTIASGDVGTVWYSLVQLPMEVSRLGTLFPVGKSMLFYPNDVYYGLYGWHSGVILNLILWVIGIIGATILLFGRKWGTFFIASAALLSYIFYFYITPLRFPQYLIGAAPFVAIINAYWIDAIYGKLKRSIVGLVIFFAGSVVLGYVLFTAFQTVNEPKKWFGNGDSIAMRTWFEQTIPKKTPVLDMVGLMFYYPQPYYACCVPFGQYRPFLSKPFPDVLTAIQKDDIQVIYQGLLGRANELGPLTRAYIEANYTSMYNGQVFIRNDVAQRYVPQLP